MRDEEYLRLKILTSMQSLRLLGSVFSRVTSRSQLQGFLYPDTTGVLLETVERAVAAIAKRVDDCLSRCASSPRVAVTVC